MFLQRLNNLFIPSEEAKYCWMVTVFSCTFDDNLDSLRKL